MAAARRISLKRRVVRWTGAARLSIVAPTLADAHCQLGQRLRAVIRDVVTRRMHSTNSAALAEQIALARRCRTHLLNLAARRANSHGRSDVLALAIVEYFSCLAAWGNAAGLERSAQRAASVDGQTISAADLAFWLQDDNTGCQTGMLRLADASVLFWHTEEDTIGYFDRARIVSFQIGEQQLHSLIYPYLIPGPAFGWSPGVFQAIDSLHVRRAPSDVGCPTCVASWLTWRLAGQLPPRRVLLALRPFVDACAINVIDVRTRQVTATIHEIGHRHVCSRSLPRVAGAWQFQPNAVSESATPLLADEALPLGERARYDARTQRTCVAVSKVLASGVPTADDIVQLLASRRGGSYAYANADVKTHCVGQASPGRIELYAAPGAATVDDCYCPQFFA